MKKILALETSTENASVTLLYDGQFLSRDLSGVQTHSHGLLPAIQSILLEANLNLSDVELLAFGCGPGAFTGVRTACGVVQGLAFGLEVKVVPVVSLLTMAEAARCNQDCLDMVCILDARMGEVYWAHYEFTAGQWRVVAEPKLGALEIPLTYAQNAGALVVVGTGVYLPDTYQHLTSISEMPHSRFMATLAEQIYLSGGSVAPELAQPLYLRNKVALTTAERLIERGVV